MLDHALVLVLVCYTGCTFVTSVNTAVMTGCTDGCGLSVQYSYLFKENNEMDNLSGRLGTNKCEGKVIPLQA
jgi:hypothetical protein